MIYLILKIDIYIRLYEQIPYGCVLAIQVLNYSIICQTIRLYMLFSNAYK